MSQPPPPPRRRVKPPGFDAFALKYRAYKASPAGQEANRPVTKFLDSLGSSAWGYVIYRTVFTSESDKEVPLAIEKLNAFVKQEVEKDLVGTNWDKSVNERVWEKWRGQVVEEKGKGLEGADVEGVRGMFLQRVREEGIGGRGVCVLLDEKGVRSLINGELDGEGDVYVTVVDGQWVAGTGDPEYPGWMKVNVRQLMRLYSVLGTTTLYQNWCILGERDQDGAFIYGG